MNKYGRLGAPVDITEMLLAKLWGKTYRQIGAMFGISAAAAYRRLRSHSLRLGVIVK